jgi:transposase
VIAFRSDLKIWVLAQPADFRKSIHTLAGSVSEALTANPYICVGRKYVAAQSR